MVTRENVTWSQLWSIAKMDLTDEDIADFGTPEEMIRYAVGGHRNAKQRCVDIFNARSAVSK